MDTQLWSILVIFACKQRYSNIQVNQISRLGWWGNRATDLCLLNGKRHHSLLNGLQQIIDTAFIHFHFTTIVWIGLQYWYSFCLNMLSPFIFFVMLPDIFIFWVTPHSMAYFEQSNESAYIKPLQETDPLLSSVSSTHVRLFSSE